MNALTQILKDQFALLFFKPFRPRLREYGKYYLLFGLLTAWLAGMGRYWDNPRAELWQHLGLGSVAYCILLAGLLYILMLPLKPKNWTYINVLIFVSLTSLPAILYAIPVERFMSMQLAQDMNVGFLAVVASWRVVLLILFLKRAAGLSFMKILVGTLLPITLIITSLSVLNLEHVVFSIMAGIEPEQVSGNDAAYSIVFLLSIFSVMAFPILLGLYFWLATRKGQDE